MFTEMTLKEKKNMTDTRLRCTQTLKSPFKKAENVYFSLSEARDTIKNKIKTLFLKNKTNLDSKKNNGK